MNGTNLQSSTNSIWDSFIKAALKTLFGSPTKSGWIQKGCKSTSLHRKTACTQVCLWYSRVKLEKEFGLLGSEFTVRLHFLNQKSLSNLNVCFWPVWLFESNLLFLLIWVMTKTTKNKPKFTSSRIVGEQSVTVLTVKPQNILTVAADLIIHVSWAAGWLKAWRDWTPQTVSDSGTCNVTSWPLWNASHLL